MSKSKLTLIVDGNWLLMSRKSVMDSRYQSEEELMKDLKLLLIKSLNVVLRTFPSIDNIMFVSDGGSWRCDIPIPEFLDVTYKGNREPDPNTNWDIIWAGYESFLNVLKSTGITVYREKGIEGDDWCCYLSKKLNSEGTNCIIWTRDHDLMQLVKTDNNGCFTVWYEKDSGLYMQQKDDDEINFLFNSSYDENEELLNQIIKASKSVNKINPSDIVIDKIIRGDLGDNVLPIVKHKGKTSDKEFRVAHKEVDFSLDYYDETQIANYVHNLTSSKNYLNRIVDDKTNEQIIEHFKYNRSLVALDTRSYPDNIYNIMCNYTDYECNRDTSMAEQILTAEKMGSQDIFDTI